MNRDFNKYQIFYRPRDLKTLFKINEINKNQDNVLCAENKISLTKKNLLLKESSIVKA